MPNQQIRIPNFKAASDKVRKLFGRTLPLLIGSEAEKHFKESFRKQGFTDGSLKAWPARKLAGTKKKYSSGILIASGNLKRSIRVIQNRDGIVWISAGNQHVPYARIHNEGGTISKTVTIREHKRQITKKMKVGSSSLKTKKSTSRKRKVTTGYATVHQHKRKMNLTIPQRQFMGESRMLNAEIDRIIQREILSLEHEIFKS